MRGQRIPPLLPSLGQPGGLDDPLRHGLSGAGYRWYLRYLEQGFRPEIARMKAEDHRNPANINSSFNNSNFNNVNSPIRMGGNRNSSFDDQYGRPSDSRYRSRSDRRDRNRGPPSSNRHRPSERGRRQTPPRSSSRGQGGSRYPLKRGRPSGGSPYADKMPRRSDKPSGRSDNGGGSNRRRYRRYLFEEETKKKALANAEKLNGDVSKTSKPDAKVVARGGIKYAVLPANYPHETLTSEEIATIEDGIIEELFNVTTTKPQFNRIQRKVGLLLVDCINQETVDWLVAIIPKLSKLEGKTLTTCAEAQIPKTYTLNFVLPRSAGQEIEKTLALIANQNEGLNTDKWKVLFHQDDRRDQLVIVMIDEKSLETIKANGNVLAYRFSKVKIRGLAYLEAIKIAGETDPKKEQNSAVTVENGKETVESKVANGGGNTNEHKNDGDYVVVEEEEYGDEEITQDTLAAGAETKPDAKVVAHGGIKYAVLPANYPHETLTSEEIATIEDGIIEELFNVTTTKPQFNRIQRKVGLLLIDCINQETVDWLVAIIPKLSKLEGKTLTTCAEAQIPKTYTLSFVLPRSAGQEIEKTLALIANQNEGLNTDKWKVLNHQDDHRDQLIVVMIDEKSLETIKASGNALAYRFSKVKIRGLTYLEANKIAGETGPEKEQNSAVIVENAKETSESKASNGDYVVVEEEEYGDEEIIEETVTASATTAVTVAQ